ncbi:MAG: hypothetical protein H7256_04945 [Bdellovibrio sp.]|nr:hypothetical protein [Bdellovibrio sp.]
MKLTFLFLISNAALGLQSCNGNAVKDLVDKAQSSSYSYTLSENNCSTGQHDFSSQEAMCDGLKNDSLNNYCASQLRHAKFQSDCPGRTW